MQRVPMIFPILARWRAPNLPLFNTFLIALLHTHVFANSACSEVSEIK